MPASPQAERVRIPPLLIALATSVALLGCGEGRVSQQAAQVGEAADLEAEWQGEWTQLAEGDPVRTGSELRTGTRPARLELPGGELWLASGTAATLHPDHVELLQGQALLQADEPLAIHWGTTQVRGTGVFRVALGATPRVGVYLGQATVIRPAERETVAALRQVSLTGRRLHATEPLAYRRADPWDSIWMDGALQLDAETARLASGIERSYGSQPQPHDFYAQFAPDAESVIALLARTARERVDGAFGPPADTLLTLFVAQATGRASLAEAVRDVLALRAEGARWGLVGVELEVSTERLAAVVDLGHAQQVAAADSDPPSASPGPASEPDPPAGGADGTGQPPPAPSEPPPAPSEPPPGDGPAAPDAPDEPAEPEGPDALLPLGPIIDPLARVLEQTLAPAGALLGGVTRALVID